MAKKQTAKKPDDMLTGTSGVESPDGGITPASDTGNGRGEARERLDAFGIDAVCERIGDGSSLTDIAEEVTVSIGSLLTWLKADAERSARAREARRATAQSWDEQAEAELRAASDVFELAKARELASHFRWRASKIAPADYGDKVQHADADGNKLPPAPQFILAPVAPGPMKDTDD